MKHSLLYTVIACLAVSTTTRGNDGVFFVNGSHIEPVHETDISVEREVLTITIGDDNYAYVDVDYTFRNNGKEKTVTVGFEADTPYNGDELIDFKNPVHPYIKDFTVTMNGVSLPYHNYIVGSSWDRERPHSLEPLDTNLWRPTEECDNDSLNEMWDALSKELLYNVKTYQDTTFACAYCFDAVFKPGLNRVRHTYRYLMSQTVGTIYEIPYWLTPAMRWAGGEIADFTLRIKAENTAKHFCINDSLFSAVKPVIAKGRGKTRYTNHYDTKIREVTLRNGVVEWHCYNFVPSADINIYSADLMLTFNEKSTIGCFYDRSERFHPIVPNYFCEPGELTAKQRRIIRNLPYASRGYVFKDASLRAYFNSQWWYMPDASWNGSTDDFLPNEWKLINDYK